MTAGRHEGARAGRHTDAIKEDLSESFPGPQKNKMEFFIYRLYQGNPKQELSKQGIMAKVRPFPFSPDVQVFFEELPDRSFDEDQLIKELNRIITKRGRADAIGGTLHRLDHIPPEWEQAWREYYPQYPNRPSGQQS